MAAIAPPIRRRETFACRRRLGDGVAAGNQRGLNIAQMAASLP